MSWENNSPLHFRLGTIALWNRLTKNTVDMKDGVLVALQKWAPEQFEELITAPRPRAMGDRV